ncbi:interleukin-27 subunit beta [Platysternon megacephalum]|uniref:Alpha/beta hydrolase domain-containing protein 14B n=1 Tax=Platysternon megacephalum TaxID=55544 RepID=A0A4D9E589_9SAUR|nr:alpha/beta hydrolase domain-containing protein 14B [Platysternon megacephalum]TFK02261.1 interleukin-27 subunit beta [Platysternon megacephalum]
MGLVTGQKPNTEVFAEVGPTLVLAGQFLVANLICNNMTPHPFPCPVHSIPRAQSGYPLRHESPKAKGGWEDGGVREKTPDQGVSVAGSHRTLSLCHWFSVP